MADELHSVVHPDPAVVHAPPARMRPRRRILRWIAVAASVIVISQVVVPFTGLFSPVLSPIVYPNLAPPNWHNATPHGNIVLYDFAVSTDEPGLVMACGALFSPAWPDPWAFGSMRFWRSKDGGADWQLFQPPFGNVGDCNLAIPAGGQGTILAEVSPSDNNNSPTTLWVSHDAGLSWHKALIIVNGDNGSVAYGITTVVYRGGLMYGSVDFGLNSATAPFGYSADDGGTWTTVKAAPDRLVQQGWQVQSTVPDYRSPEWWYRELSRPKSVPLLEHSEDNGVTWSVVGPVGTSPLSQLTLLATTPQAPDYLCEGATFDETRQLLLFASSDGGHSWRTATMPKSLHSAQGETTLNVAIGSTGDCYQGFHYGMVQAPENGLSHYGILALAGDSGVLRFFPLTDRGGGLALNVGYVPAHNGMPARLVSELDGASPGWGIYPGWAPLFSGLASETTAGGQIIWHTVP